MRRPNACRCNISGPNGVTNFFQRSSYSSEPYESIRSRNLLSKNDCRLAVADESVELGPEVSRIGIPSMFAVDADEVSSADRARDRMRSTTPRARFLFSCARERWTWARAGENSTKVTDSGEANCFDPACNSTEEMCLVKSSNVICPHVEDAALVDFSIWDEFLSDEFGNPSAGVGIVFVVVVHPITTTRPRAPASP